MIDWKRKLSSRKFWVAVVAFVSAILIAFNVPEGSVEQITSIIMSFATLIAYIFAEGFVDAASKDIEVEVLEDED